MTVFDMGKNIHPPTSHFFLGQDVFDAIKNACKPNVECPTDYLFGVGIVLVEDHAERKERAFIKVMTTGHPVFYEDEDGNIMKVSIQKAEGRP